MEKPLEMAWVGSQVGWFGLSRNHWGNQCEPGWWHLCICSVVSEKEQWSLPVLLSGRKPPFQLSPWYQTTQFLPLCPWYLFICCSNNGAQRYWVWVILHTGLSRGTAWDSSILYHTQPQYLLDFAGRRYGKFSFWHWNPGCGALYGAGTPYSSGGTSAAEISLWILICIWHILVCV